MSVMTPGQWVGLEPPARTTEPCPTWCWCRNPNGPSGSNANTAWRWMPGDPIYPPTEEPQ